MTVLVTGASGFVGRAIVRELRRAGLPVRIASRHPERFGLSDAVLLPAANAPADAFDALVRGVTHVVHCAGLSGGKGVAEADYRNVNAVLTGRLAEAAAQAIEGRFIYISSIRAAVDPDFDGVIDDAVTPRPTGPYGRSKREGELRALEAYDNAGPPGLAILRLPPVHGPGMGGNLRAMLRLADTGLPLPIAALRSKRSLISVESAARAVRHLIETPALGRSIYLAADREAVSVAEIIAAFRAGFGRPERLFRLPPAFLGAAASAIGKRAFWKSLIAGQVCDPAALISEGWQPTQDSFAALQATARLSRASADKGSKQNPEIEAG